MKSAQRAASTVGSDTTAGVPTGVNHHGIQTAIRTCYVNINLSSPFDTVVATRSHHAFEFDNVAFDTGQISAPEPGTVGMFLLGLALPGSGCWLRKRKTM